jgi:hypothetical protein
MEWLLNQRSRITFAVAEAINMSTVDGPGGVAACDNTIVHHCVK